MTRLLPLWLSLALGACAPKSTKLDSDSSAGDAGEGTGPVGGAGQGGRGGTSGTSGTGNIDGGTGPTGGFSGASGDAGMGGVTGGPRLNRVERVGDAVRAVFDQTSGFYRMTCSRGTELTKANGSPWIDAQPACGIPYYIDERYQENVETEQCGFDCDYADCEPLPSVMTFSTYDLVHTGFRPAPDGVGGAGGAGGEGGEPPSIPVIESIPYPGPYLLTIRYYTSSSCRGPILEQAPILLELPIDDGAAGAAN